MWHYCIRCLQCTKLTIENTILPEDEKKQKNYCKVHKNKCTFKKNWTQEGFPLQKNMALHSFEDENYIARSVRKLKHKNLEFQIENHFHHHEEHKILFYWKKLKVY